MLSWCSNRSWLFPLGQQKLPEAVQLGLQPRAQHLVRFIQHHTLNAVCTEACAPHPALPAFLFTFGRRSEASYECGSVHHVVSNCESLKIVIIGLDGNSFKLLAGSPTRGKLSPAYHVDHSPREMAPSFTKSSRRPGVAIRMLGLCDIPSTCGCRAAAAVTRRAGLHASNHSCHLTWSSFSAPPMIVATRTPRSFLNTRHSAATC